MRIKIYGERNSGTGFLEFLLRKNVVDDINNVYVSPHIGKKVYGWKHGIPVDFNSNLFFNRLEELEEGEEEPEKEPILYICIFRELDSWLKSMYSVHYHLKTVSQLEKFLTTKHEVLSKQNGIDYYTNNFMNNDDKGKTIFDIRYHKLDHHTRFFMEQDNIIHISLDFLQKDTIFLLHVLKKIYDIEMNEVLNTNIPYTKKIKIREKYDKYKNNLHKGINIEKHRHIIDSSLRPDYEKYVNNLKMRCKLDGKIIK